ncbi:MAG: GNAT family N-acetyltransferase [Pseudomonadota bacterium]
MTEMLRFNRPSKFESLVTIKPLTIDDMSSVRHLHALCFRRSMDHVISEAALAAHDRYIASIDYLDQMTASVKTEQVFAAWLEGTLIGTAGWADAETTQRAARLRWAYVNPMFADRGVGRRLVSTVELSAMRSGFEAISAKATPSLSDFLRTLGYVPKSQGDLALTTELVLSVTLMRKQLIQPGITALQRH